jgi:macrodomain Ter protein organizer (MatP/YcbG family)
VKKSIGELIDILSVTNIKIFYLVDKVQRNEHTKEDAKKIAKRDAIKKSFALNNKYEFLEIWSVADIETEIIKKLNQILIIMFNG